MKLLLNTVSVINDGCFSVLLTEKQVPFAVTVERTFDNRRVVIGNGEYRCVKSHYYKGGYPTFEILVPGHTRVLFHKGNTEDDSTACVCVAESFGELSGKTAVLDSRAGFSEFWQLTKNVDEFSLIVSGR